jgi:hypothetical protein
MKFDASLAESPSREICAPNGGRNSSDLGCRRCGRLGRRAECQYLCSVGFDGTLNYRTDTPYVEKLAALCPHGID